MYTFIYIHLYTLSRYLPTDIYLLLTKSIL